MLLSNYMLYSAQAGLRKSKPKNGVSLGLWAAFGRLPVRQICESVTGFSLFFAVLGFELRASTLSHPTSPVFMKGFFEIGSCELFPRAGFEPQSS
jgi:hypothetical protein